MVVVVVVCWAAVSDAMQESMEGGRERERKRERENIVSALVKCAPF